MDFLLKKIVGALMMPTSALFFLGLLAVFCYLAGKKSVAKTLALIGFCAFYVLTITPTKNLLVSPLEFAYPKYANQEVDYVVVLGGWHALDERKPITSTLSTISLARLMEGIRVLRLNPDAKLLLSGYGGEDEISNAEAMSLVAQTYGVAENEIELRPLPRDTEEEAEAWARFLGDSPFALVTSASHMPRGIKLFKQQGLDPVAAPTAYMGGETNWWHFRTWMPMAINLTQVEAAWHEYLGLLWIDIKS